MNTLTGFEVSPGISLLSGIVQACPRAWIACGDFESNYLKEDLTAIKINSPIFVAGLARAGSTMLLEFLSQHSEVGTHRYQDFPFLFTPYIWNRILGLMVRRPAEPQERSHQDRLLVTPESPEAMEEKLWMAFFPALHDPSRGNMLDADVENPIFETFYRDHIRKLLLIRSRDRYASKGNYNVTRLMYLHKLFPDARFIIPIRQPENHVASSIRQHQIFSEGLKNNPRGRTHLKQVGHFEFGPDRRPINADDTPPPHPVAVLWEQGEEIRGWARYWAHIYGAVDDMLASSSEIKAASLVLRYEDLLSSPTRVLQAVLDHGGLTADAALVSEFASKISAPDYYDPGLKHAELAVIREETRAIAKRFGYE